ncbi:hypothetical protein D3C80_892490 [compost metagenome]
MLEELAHVAQQQRVQARLTEPVELAQVLAAGPLAGLVADDDFRRDPGRGRDHLQVHVERRGRVRQRGDQGRNLRALQAEHRVDAGIHVAGHLVEDLLQLLGLFAVGLRQRLEIGPAVEFDGQLASGVLEEAFRRAPGDLVEVQQRVVARFEEANRVVPVAQQEQPIRVDHRLALVVPAADAPGHHVALSGVQVVTPGGSHRYHGAAADRLVPGARRFEQQSRTAADHPAPIRLGEYRPEFERGSVLAHTLFPRRLRSVVLRLGPFQQPGIGRPATVDHLLDDAVRDAVPAPHLVQLIEGHVAGIAVLVPHAGPLGVKAGAAVPDTRNHVV